jgi:hypothetical protein
MDFLTIPSNEKIIKEKKLINKIYCLCFWGRNTKIGHNSIEELKVDFPYNRVLTPWNYNLNNTFLGFNIDVLYKNIISNKRYEKIGVLYGKMLKCLNIDLITYLTDRNIKFYCVSHEPLEMKNIHNLGNLSPTDWRQLLTQCGFILGFGDPRVGPTILECIYYKVPFISPLSQIVNSGIEYTKNFYDTTNLIHNEVYQIVSNIEWKNDNINLFEHTEMPYLNRLKKIIYNL